MHLGRKQGGSKKKPTWIVPGCRGSGARSGAGAQRVFGPRVV